ncbi:Transcriptional regulator, AraC family [Granulibacter bethesdensis]|nr:Transcriptional regulator, AraC family [Granulibacter bethesdensis]
MRRCARPAPTCKANTRRPAKVALRLTSPSADPPRRRALTVGFVMADSFTLAPFSLFVDHLRLAADEGDMSRPIRCQWSIMGSRPGTIAASCGITIGPTTGFIDPKQLDYIVVVGGLLHAGRPFDQETVAYLQSAARAGTTLVGLCTGSFLLCRAGLMKDRTTCVSWYHHQDFTDEFPEQAVLADRLFLVDGDRITCAGGGGAADLATWIVEKHLGRSTAMKSRQVLLLDEARGETAAQPHPPLAAGVTDPRVRRALLIMEQNMAEPLPVSAIAERLDLSARQLERLFAAAMQQKPAAVYRSLRLRFARFLLDNTQRSVTEIALDAGFSDCAHFSRLYKAAHGVAPSTARRNAPPAAESNDPLPERDSLTSSRIYADSL